MFSRGKYIDPASVISGMRDDNIALRTKVELLTTQLAIAQNNFEWARVRLNHVEDERAALLHRVVGMQIPAPKIERSGRESMADVRTDLNSIIGQISFDDVGDDEAKKLGVDHEPVP
jgi:hypothetical protein